MAKYGSFQYGTAKTYGASAVTEGGLVTWVLSIDWDDDGVFDGSSEAARLVGLNCKAGREFYLSAGGSGFDHMRPANVTLKLDNFDRRYDPRNASSPLYPNVTRGHKVQIRVRDNENDVFYTVFTGVLDDIRPVYTRGGGDVTFECVGFLQQLLDTELTATAARINTTIHNALVALLDDVKYPGGILLDAETQPVPSFGPVDQKAGEVAMSLADAGLGTFFVDRTGRARYYSRNHSSFTEHNLDQAQMGVEIETTQPWDNRFNEIRVTGYNQIYQQGAVIYYLSTPVRVESGTPVTIYPKYPPARDVQVSGIEGNDAIDGNGTDITEDLAYTASLGIAGGSVVVTPTATGYITNLEIRGRAFGSSPEEFSESDTTLDPEIHGLKRFKLDTPYLQDRNYASEFVGILGSDNDFLYGEREAFRVTIRGRPDIQFGYELLDVINLTSDYLDVDGAYYVLGYEIKSIDNMQDIETILYLDTILQDATSITAAGIETAQQQAPTGYQNPAGDPETLNTSPELPLTSRCCALYGSVVLSPTGTGYMTFTTEITDPDDMITAPSAIVTIPEDGQYFLTANSRFNCTYGYSGVGDTTGLLAARLTIYFYKNDVNIDANFGESSARFYKYGSNWFAQAQSTNFTIQDLVAGDQIKFYYNASLSGTPDTAWSGGGTGVVMHVMINKVKGATA